MRNRKLYIALYYAAAALFVLAAVFFFRRGDSLMGVISSALSVSMAGLGTVWAVTRNGDGAADKTKQQTKQ